MHTDPAPPGPPGADAQPAIPTQTPQNAEAGTHTGTGLRADAQRRQWRALLTCGHRVEVVQLTSGPADPPTTVECPRCGVRQPVDVYPLTALSDPDNVGWQRVEDDR
ncbi:zinc ribbon domain-containing protein [Blastococcus saxobsidens]|uniref:Uncharacterized protein n=1 Tax=Blastococcus saxobsidens TaxID=138336 RepID=A0A4Q7Y1G9_9ACTN|nr:zinc ribbon domain-containing protein [Blastococcus saxobsidens]RZU30622.1 hypothetical protein BKA19_0242 [Blastococcus saxobsidens]